MYQEAGPQCGDMPAEPVHFSMQHSLATPLFGGSTSFSILSFKSLIPQCMTVQSHTLKVSSVNASASLAADRLSEIIAWLGSVNLDVTVSSRCYIRLSAASMSACPTTMIETIASEMHPDHLTAKAHGCMNSL